MGLFPRESLIIYIFKRGIRPFSARIHWGVSNQTRPVPNRLQLLFCSRVMGEFQPDPRPHHPDPLSFDTVLLQNMGHRGHDHVFSHASSCVLVFRLLCHWFFCRFRVVSPIACGIPGVGAECSPWLASRSLPNCLQGECPVPNPSQCYAWFSFTSTTMTRKPC